MNTPVSKTPGTDPSTLIAQYDQRVQQTGNISVETKKGILGQTVTVPTTVEKAQFLLEALRTMAPDNAILKDMEVLLAMVTAKLKDALGKVEESRANSEMEAKRVGIKENEAKIAESKQKLDEAEAKRKSGDLGALLQLIFEAIAGLAQIIGGAVWAVFGGGQLAVGMIASGAIMLMVSINSAVSMATGGTGILGSIAKAFGASDEVAMGLDMAFVGAMVVTGVVVAMATGTGAIGAAYAAEKGAALAAQIGVQVANMITNVGSAASQVATGVVKYEAAESSSQAKMKQAQSDELQALLKQLDDLIDMALAMLMQVKGNVNAMIDSYTEMLNDTGNTLSNTRFSG
jgi:hypothetical protein